jgi:murein DD-endopeptidase MepM/ murein hydrolase activator NlpD
MGQKVYKGDVIALSGNTGKSSAPHLHYEIEKDGVPIDPSPYLD